MKTIPQTDHFMSGLKKTTHFGDIYEKRGFDVWDIETKTKILSNVAGTEVEFLLGMTFGASSSYATSKSKRKHNGKKYAIRFASTKDQCSK